MSLKQKVSELQAAGLNLIEKYSAKIIGLLILSVGLIGGGLLLRGDGKMRPGQTREFARTSVMIVDMQARSGGSGVILRSTETYSEILTNKHVCRLVTGEGGLVISNGQKYLVDSVKTYPKHDLCMIKVYSNLGVNTKVADVPPSGYEGALISGHPALLPHVLTTGNFSGKEIIQLLVAIRKCTKEEELGEYGMYCILLGGFPIIESFQAQLATGTILPGSSGSAVYNSKGEISGLVFAGNGDGLGYAFIVPHEYIVDFLENEDKLKYKRASAVDYDKTIRSIFEKQKNCTQRNKQFENLCKRVESYLIWEIK